MALAAEDSPLPGSAAWWLARSREPAERRPRKDGITLERVIAAAIGVIDADGHEALTMRRVADELGTGAASLYRHVASREELIALVVDDVIGSLSGAPPPGVGWRASAEWLARRFREHLLAHRGVVPLISAAQLLGPSSMLGREVAISLLVAAGFAPEDAVRSYLAILHFVVATVQLDVRAAARAPAERRVLRELFASQDPDRFPTVVAHAGLLAAQRSEDEFEFGLRAMLDGIECGLRAMPDGIGERRSH